MITQLKLENLRTGFQTIFKKGLGKVEPKADLFSTPVNSTTKVETYGWLTDMPIFTLWVGAKKIRQLAERAYSLFNDAFEVTVGINKHDLADDKLGLYSMQVEGWGQEAGALKDRMCFEALANGHLANVKGRDNTCYDGKAFFATDHKVGKLTFSNKTGDNSKEAVFFVCLNKSLKPILYQLREAPHFNMITDPENSHVFKTGEYLMGGEARAAAGYTYWQLAHRFTGALTAANYETIRTAFASIKNEEGEPLGLRPTHIIVGTSNRAAAKSLFDVQRLENGADNIYWKELEIIEADRLP